MALLALILSFMSCSNIQKCTHQASLKEAVFSADENQITKLIEKGSNLNEPIACNNYLPLEAAISINDMELFKFLIKNGATSNYRCCMAAEKSDNKQFKEILNEVKFCLRSKPTQCKK